MKSIKLIRVISVCTLLFWMLSIFLLSNQTAAESSDTSGGFSEVLFSTVYPGFDNMTAQEQSGIIESSSFYIRKLAHFCVYGVLGALAYLSFVTYKKFCLSLKTLASVIFCILYAVSDELHQTYVPGRSGEFRDVLIDSAGALFIILILCFLTYGIKRIYNLISRDSLTESGFMRKKEICNLYLNTVDELNKLRNENSIILNKIEECQKSNVELNEKIESILCGANNGLTEQNTEKSVSENDDTDYLFEGKSNLYDKTQDNMSDLLQNVPLLSADESEKSESAVSQNNAEIDRSPNKSCPEKSAIEIDKDAADSEDIKEQQNDIVMNSEFDTDKNTYKTIDNTHGNTNNTNEKDFKNFDSSINYNFNDEQKYGAKVIGDIVKTAVKYSVKISNNISDKQAGKVNLIFSQTEIQKSNIFNIIVSDDSLQNKINKMDKCKKNAFDYFDSIF